MKTKTIVALLIGSVLLILAYYNPPMSLSCAMIIVAFALCGHNNIKE